jgi:hypothetical protein
MISSLLPDGKSSMFQRIRQFILSVESFALSTEREKIILNIASHKVSVNH